MTDSNNDSWRNQRTEQRNGGDRAQTQPQTQQQQTQQYQRRDENRSYNRNGQDQYRNNNQQDQYRNNNRQDQYRNDGNRNYNRDQQYQHRNETRSYDRRDSYRNYGHAEGDRGRAYSMRGRVERYEPWNGGYRVWIGGGGYPFFVTSDWFRLHHLRVGLDIALGGFWNPLGYYDVYDTPYGYYNTAGDLHGVVESVDYRRGTIVLRDDISGNFVTTVMRGNDPRFGDLRPGDYVDLTGDWSRGGFFNAYNVAQIGDGRYGYDGRY